MDRALKTRLCWKPMPYQSQLEPTGANTDNRYPTRASRGNIFSILFKFLFLYNQNKNNRITFMKYMLDTPAYLEAVRKCIA